MFSGNPRANLTDTERARLWPWDLRDWRYWLEYRPTINPPDVKPWRLWFRLDTDRAAFKRILVDLWGNGIEIKEGTWVNGSK